ncbi:hypothetical protein [Micromonospora rosaria]|uniref:hypothetical protein n=1 Tax=Micromonospora rosaria TaxID=47874 RepID=UPI000AAFB691|nr:hypothetical protein [Micromonospora rosaria]
MTAVDDQAPRPGQRSAAVEAALAAVRARTPGHARRPDRVALLDGPEAAARLAVTPDRWGQFRIAVPAQARSRPVHPTGQQTGCVRCAAAGVDRQGVSRDGVGSDPLCLPCWRGPRERQGAGNRRRLVAELRQRLDLDVPEGCAVCGSAHPVPECWLCGWSHLAAASAAQEAADAAEAARVAEEFDRITEIAEAQDRVDELAAWVDRLHAVLEGHQAGSGRARAVRLLADLLARDTAARSTTRGRPGALARVAAVMAVDADWRSGRRAMPGRARTAELAGCTQRAVTSAWARSCALGWATRTHAGRRLSLPERIETGRSQDRACYDLTPVHQGDLTAQAALVPTALAVLADLLDHADTLLAAAQQHLDGLRARAGGWAERRDVERLDRMRKAVAAAVTRAVVAPAITARPIDTGNLFAPRMAPQGENLSSCPYQGLLISPSIAYAASEDRRGRRKSGASRSSTRAGRHDRRDGAGRSPGRHPRPRQGVPAGSRAARPLPKWSGWAYDLARAVQDRWVWLRPAPLPRVAATLGATLGSDWTAEALDAWVRRSRSQALLAAPDNPVAYLRAVLEDVLTGLAAPPHPARRHTEHRRALVVEQAAADRAARAADRDQDATAVAVPGRRSAAAEAALAEIRARTSGHLRRTDRAALLDDGAGGECDWPEVAKPGAGLPPTARP